MSDERLKHYSHAMTIDQATNKVMPKVAIAGAEDTGGGKLPTDPQPEHMQPTELQRRVSRTIQTHNAVSVGANGNSTSQWFECTGFEVISILLNLSTSLAHRVDVHWSQDGVNIDGHNTSVINSSSGTRNAVDIPVRSRFFQVVFRNQESTGSVTASLKAHLKV